MATHGDLQNLALSASRENANNIKATLLDEMAPLQSLLSRFVSSLAIVQTVLGLSSPVHRLNGDGTGASAVCNNPQLSCHNSSAVEDLCCFNSPGGSLLQTQFWDTDPQTGPDDSWTIHGLWVSSPRIFDYPVTNRIHVA